ncbi:MAG TPA: glycosyltransferase [Allosphingosinicella sp.]|nr:glycosyltransferase [Allosphingosinicella sp.]
MPVYRGERWIEASLESLAHEVDEGVELLVIDSSPDRRTADIVRRFSDRLRLRIEEHSALPSWQSKTNHAARIAAADHLCWLHHDDLWLPGRGAAIRRWINEAPGAALHLATSAIIDEHGRQIGIWRCPFRGDGEIPSGVLVERLLVQNFVSAPAPVYRKDAWLRAGGLDEQLWYTGDWDIWLKLAEHGSVWHHQEMTTAFRVHGSSLTVTGSRNAEDFEHQMRTVLERHLPRLSPVAMRRVNRIALASVEMNLALAAASTGRWRGLLLAVLRVLVLGPAGIHSYVRDSRIVDRLVPRLRARLSGSM